MKKHLLIAIAILCSAVVFGQAKTDLKDALKPQEVTINDTNTHYWRYTGFFGVNFGQVALVNWAAGGQNSISIQANANATLTYEKKHLLWDNQLLFALGGIASGRLRQPSAKNAYPFRKNVDMLQITSRVGYIIDAKKHWTAAFLADLKTNVMNGWDYTAYDAGTGPRQLTSTSFSPSYVLLSLGINYKPVSYFSVFLSPVTAKLTIMNANKLDTANGTYTSKVDRTRYGLDNGMSYRASVGAYLRADFQKDIYKNINLKTSVELFQNYTDKHMLDGIVQSELNTIYAAYPSEQTNPSAATKNLQNHLYYDNRPNTYVNWNTAITFKVNKFITASLETQLLYDHTVAVPHLLPDGTTYQGRGTQFREAFTLGFGYKFK
ncbi:MAG: DUF3078 domain-containing protein [Bacteroidetes bacterium]|nr:DUF3078 domain-containing protein [Bacteroidota bacterium]